MEQSQVKSDTDQESAILRALHEKYPNQSFEALPPEGKFEICKLAIEHMATALQGVNLRKLGNSPSDPFGIYEDDLFKILGHLQSLHEISPIGNQLKMDEFRPFIDKAVEHLSSALMYKDIKEFHDYMHHLIAFSHAISEAKEKLEPITVNNVH